MKKITQIIFSGFALLLATSTGFAQQDKNNITSVTGQLVRVTPPLKDIDGTTMYGLPLKITRNMKGVIGRSEEGEEKLEKMLKKQEKNLADFVWKNSTESVSPNIPVSSIVRNFDGQTWSGFDPTDNNIAVGSNHIIQMINDQAGSKVQIWDKAGNVVQAPVTLASITGISGAGDPIVVYDQLADRWLLTEFGPGGSCCNSLIIAVSVTNNPTGSWKIYQYTDASFFPDFPKYSVWNTTAYFARTSDFNTSDAYIGSSIYAFDRQAMLAGAATATMVRVRMLTSGAINYYNMNCIGLDGTTPSSQSGLFAVPEQTRIHLFEFTPNFTIPASSVVGPLVPINITGFNSPPGSVDQPGSTNIETLGYRLSYRLSYRNRSGTESILISHTVRGATTSLSDIRWYEMRRTAATWTLYQQGNIRGADGQSRLIPGIAQDALGNIAAMYNVSGNTTFPSIRYTARNECDPLGQMTLPEQTIINGTVNHTLTSRWGDYNTLVADPTINGSFWSTAQYGGTPAGGNSGNATRIANFTITTGAASFTLQPQAATICVGTLAAFSVLVESNNTITYQWQRSNDNGNTWGNIANATTTNYSFTAVGADNGSQFRCIATRTCGTPGTSNAALLSVKSAPPSPVITTPNGSPGICNGSSVQLTSNVGMGNALSFTKTSSQYVVVPHSASINLGASFTMEAWVNYSGLYSTIVDKGDYDFLWQLGANGNANKMGFFNKATTTWFYATGSVPQNSWTHVAITLNAGIITFYINGVASGTATTAFSQDDQPMNIGRQQPTSCVCNHYNGKMDDLRLWNVARSQTEIQNNMNAVAANSTGLVAYYKFDESTGTTTADATTNGNNGTLTNGPTWQPRSNIVWTPGGATTQSITASAPGSYTATITYDDGCVSAASTTVTLLPPPAAPNVTANGSTAICTGQSVTLNANVGINNALSFNSASSQYVTVPHSSSINLGATFSMEAWVNYSGLNRTIIDKGDYDYLWELNPNTNLSKMGVYNKNTNTWHYSTGTVPQNTWTHVAITYGAGVVTFYINGIASGSAATSFFQDNQPMNIGRQQPTFCACNHFNGTMDELRLWNVVRTQAEIQTYMNTNVPTNSTGLVAYYKFDAGTGTTVADATAYGNNGSFVNDPTWQVPATSPVNRVVWTPANVIGPTITAYTSGTYTATITNGFGCTNATSTVVTAYNTAPPNLGPDVTVNKDCFGETTDLTTLFNTTALTPVWNTATPAVAPPGTYRIIAANSSGCTDTSFAIIILEVATWIGRESNDWNTPGNWSTNKVPGTLTHVIVPNGTLFPCIISTANAVAASVQVRGGILRTINNKQAVVNGKCLVLPPN